MGAVAGMGLGDGLQIPAVLDKKTNFCSRNDRANWLLAVPFRKDSQATAPARTRDSGQ